MTQLHDDVNGWYGGRLRPVPDPPPDDDRDEPRPAAANPLVDEETGLWGASELWDRDPAGAPGDGEPLFEELRSAYLHDDDSSEWARDGEGTGGWADDSVGRERNPGSRRKLPVMASVVSSPGTGLPSTMGRRV